MCGANPLCMEFLCADLKIKKLHEDRLVLELEYIMLAWAQSIRGFDD